MGLRYVLGPSFGFTRATPPAPPSGKQDVAVELAGVDGGLVRLRVPPYDPATHNRLVDLRAYLVPNGTQPPDAAAGYLGSALPFAAVDVSGHQEGVEAAVPLPDVPDGDYLGQVVLGFES